MSIIRADSIKNRVGDGAPDFPNGITVTGIVTATTLNQNVSGVSTFAGNVDINADLDVDGHTNLDNVSVAGVVTATAVQASSFVGGTISGTTGTFSGNVSIGGTLTYEDLTNVDSVGMITARSGVRVPGGDISINSDTGKLYLGAGNDLHIYHAGNHSYIQDNGTGALYVGSNGGGVYIRGQHGEESIIANSHGKVSLYYDNSLKFTTETSGVNITGVCTATSFSGDGSALTGITQTTINGNADNRIITGSGTANTLNAEGSFTFDSGVADITGKLRIDVDSTSGAGSGSVEAIFLRNTNETDGNAVTIFAGADDYAAAASAINFINIDHSANTGAITFDTRKTGNVYAEKMRISSEGYVTKPLNVSFCVFANSDQAYSGNTIFVCNSPSTSGVCHNIGGHFNASTGEFTAPVAGRYWLSMDTAPQFLSSSPTDGWQITIQKNGVDSEVTDMLYGGGSNGNEDHVRADGILNLAANDVIRWHMNGYGGSMNFVRTKFQGYLLG